MSPPWVSLFSKGKSMPCICIPKRLTLHLSFFITPLACWFSDFHILCQMFQFINMCLFPYFQTCLESLFSFLLLFFNDRIRGQDTYLGPFFSFFLFSPNRVTQDIVAEFGVTYTSGSFTQLKNSSNLVFCIICSLLKYKKQICTSFTSTCKGRENKLFIFSCEASSTFRQLALKFEVKRGLFSWHSWHS